MERENIEPAASTVFAVYFPEDIRNSPRTVFGSVKEAAKFANSPEAKQRGARFRRFGTQAEALTFIDSTDHTRTTDYNQGDTNEKKVANDPAVPYPSVSRIEMNKLKKIVESDDLTEFLILADSNPRYLVNTSGDTPAIVQEGFRFNALHIAARNGSALIAEHILKFVSDLPYLTRLYGTNEEDAQLRRENILCGYLNTPDKGNGDTPLHLASKMGHVEVARIILSYSETKREQRNKSGERAIDVICSRYSGEDKKRKDTLLRSIFNSHYVALYRCDLSAGTQLMVTCEYPSESAVPSQSVSPLLTPFSLSAVVGPFDSESRAKEFMRSWKRENVDERRRDFYKGMERVGRSLAFQEGLQWAETWPFSSRPIHLNNPQGLRVVEDHLKTLRFGEDREEDEKGEEFEDALDHMDRREELNESVSSGTSDSLSSLTQLLHQMSLHSPVPSNMPRAQQDCDEGSSRPPRSLSPSSSIEDYSTPPSSPPPLYLHGTPTRTDSHLYEVLCHVPRSLLDPFPNVRFFISTLEKTDACRRQEWPSFSPRVSASSSPQRTLQGKPRMLSFDV